MRLGFKPLSHLIHSSRSLPHCDSPALCALFYFVQRGAGSLPTPFADLGGRTQLFLKMLGVAWKRFAALNRRYPGKTDVRFAATALDNCGRFFSTANLDNEKQISKERKLIKDVTKGQMSYLKNISLKSLEDVDSDIIFEYVPNNGVIKVFGTDPRFAKCSYGRKAGNSCQYVREKF